MDLLTRIEYNISNLIQTISQGSYYFNWGPSNELDLAKAQFPCAQIFIENENCLDDPDGTSSNMYFQEVIFRIEVYATLDQEIDNPRFAINQELNKALVDLKRLFGNNWSLEYQGVAPADTIMYTGMTREYIEHNDVFVPSKMITNWRVRYEQDRTNPDIIA